jgi:pyruvate/2-oxoglutarate dehydrogenase complex dihydrolipoamide dehydrogenase (E3) component
VYVAGAHGALIVDNAFDYAGRTLDYHHLPRVTFTSPQAAGDVIAAADYALNTGMTVADPAGTWRPYLTMAEGLKLAAQTFTRDVSNCPAAPPEPKGVLHRCVTETRRTA